MGRLVLTMHVSADGYIAEPDGGLWPGFGWPPTVQGRLNDIYDQASLVIYRRGIYQAVVPWWSAVARGQEPDGADEIGEEGRRFARLLSGLPKVVVSTTLAEPDDGTTVIRANAVDQVRDLVEAASGDVVLLAGGRLVSELMDAAVLKDIVLIVGTVFLGGGRPLLRGLTQLKEAVLIEAEAFPPTTSWLRYLLS